MSSEARVRRRWTAEEDEQLRKEVTSQHLQGSVRDWNRIAAKLLGRTNKDCRKRWLKVHKNLKRGPWDNAEDARLRQAIQVHGFSWTKVAMVVETRHADQCARRWQHSLDPSIDHSVWKEEEYEKLLVAVQSFGHNWTAIAENCMPLRSATDIRNRYILISRKGQRNSGSSASAQENKFQTCNPAQWGILTESGSEAGDSEAEEIEEGAFRRSTSLRPKNSSRNSPAPQSASAQQCAPNSVSFPDLNYHAHTAPTSTTDLTAVMSSTTMDYGFSAQDQMFPSLVSQSTSDEMLESFFGAESMAPLGVDWGSHAGTGTATPVYDSFSTPISGTSSSTQLSGQDSPPVMCTKTRSPMRATLTLEATSSALTDLLQTLLKTNTKFTIEAA